jgi:hypothetical protein
MRPLVAQAVREAADERAEALNGAEDRIPLSGEQNATNGIVGNVIEVDRKMIVR